jgi:hypothetical protein
METNAPDAAPVKTDTVTPLDQTQTTAQSKSDEITVNPDVYLNMQMAQFDAKAADAEIAVAEAQLALAKIKRQKIQAIIDFSVDQIKNKQQILNAQKSVEQSKEPEVKDK